MKLMPDWTIGLMRLVIAGLLPVFLVLTDVRLLLTHAFPRFEYFTRPGFPPDPYGFTSEERLKWANLSVDYLLNDRGSDFVTEMRFADGSPVYNPREVKHFVDVKNAVTAALRVWLASGAVILTLGFGLGFSGNVAALRGGLIGGALLTLGILGALVLFMLLAWNQFFVNFHQVFFEPGTWTFAYSDTFIRLFPQTFWQDAFIFIGAAAIVEAVAMWLVAGRWQLVHWSIGQLVNR